MMNSYNSNGPWIKELRIREGALNRRIDEKTAESHKLQPSANRLIESQLQSSSTNKDLKRFCAAFDGPSIKPRRICRQLFQPRL